MRSRNQAPVILRGTIASDGSTTLLSGLHLHFPDRVYSATISQSRMKWPGLPQKLQALPPGAPIPDAMAPVLHGLLPACWDWIATLNISPRLATIAVSASILTALASGGLGVAGTGFGVGDGGSASDIDAAPVRT